MAALSAYSHVPAELQYGGDVFRSVLLLLVGDEEGGAVSAAGGGSGTWLVGVPLGMSMR